MRDAERRFSRHVSLHILKDLMRPRIKHGRSYIQSFAA
jgi:hypothetical protein